MNNFESNFKNSFNKDDFDFKKEFFKYLFFWKYFLASILIFLFIVFIFQRYSHKIYETTAKIQILDKKQSSLDLPSAEDLFSNSKINLENELEVLLSTSILEQVVKNLDMNFYIESVGDIMTTRILKYPFIYKSKINNNKILKNKSYLLELNDNGLLIKNLFNEKEYLFKKFSTLMVDHDLPFEIIQVFKDDWPDEDYKINLLPVSQMVSYIKKSLSASQVGKQSDIIKINIKNSNKEFSALVLNELINVFNSDGVRDRQLIHKRTIDFVNDRYVFLSSELDSIEVDKKTFKINNDLIDLPLNSKLSLEKNEESEAIYFSNENQIYIVENLIESLNKTDNQLLPSNIGIENMEINYLINTYNSSVLDQKKLFVSAGPNNPSLILLNSSIDDYRSNIIFSLKNYLTQLNIIKQKISNKLSDIEGIVANIPEQEKSLRSIERNQQIKESLYLFLLQKSEEAQVSFAVTEPSIKIVEYAISGSKPISPNSKILYFGALLLGVLLPFLVLYLIFLFDDKVHSREDLEKFSLNVLAEIPFFDLPESEKVFANPDDRSIISESFRMLMSNVRYLQKNDSSSNVILVTSSIKGEGKTLNALNLALSFSSVGKKVLLIGCDLRNPQLHKYIGYDKNVSGLVDYLFDNKKEWEKNIINPFDTQPLDILLSGPLPPNPLNLINNGNIDILLKNARKIYDYIIIDSAPTLLVADTLSLINKSDVLIFLTRCNVTDNDVLSHIKKVSDEFDTNVGVILNGIGQQNSYGYSYGYRYGYGYNYKYSYNYGYGYGYNEESS